MDSEFMRLIAAVDLSSQAKMNEFKRWQDEDGELQGLIAVLVKNLPLPARLQDQMNKGIPPNPAYLLGFEDARRMILDLLNNPAHAPNEG